MPNLKERGIVDMAKEAIAATKGAVKLASLAYRVGSYGYRLDDAQRRAYVANLGHEPPDPYDQPGRFQQFTYSARNRDASIVLAAARVA